MFVMASKLHIMQRGFSSILLKSDGGQVKRALLLLAVASVPTAAYAQGGFDGAYAGVSAGYVSSKDDGIEIDPSTGKFDGYTQDTSPKGGAFGVLAGYRWRLRNLVLGVEADYEQRSASDEALSQYNGTPDPTYPFKTDVKAAYSARTNLGYLVAARTVAYITGGYAAAHLKRTFSDTSLSRSLVDTTWQHGWTAGLGMEQIINSNLSVRLEYRYADYGKTSINAGALWSNSIEQQKYTEQSVRMGVAYLF